MARRVLTSQVPLAERFLEKAPRSGEGCWEWQGRRAGGGYGEIRNGGKTVKAHRLAWEYAYGPIPDGIEVCHSCDNPPCVRPDHLFLGTHADNMHDRDRKGRSGAHLRSGELNGQSKLNEAQVSAIRREHAAGGVTYRALAARYGVSSVLIRQIVLRRAWKRAA